MYPEVIMLKGVDGCDACFREKDPHAHGRRKRRIENVLVKLNKTCVGWDSGTWKETMKGEMVEDHWQKT